MRVVETFAAYAGSELDPVAPKGSLIRTTDTSEEAGLAFHTARFLGTAPRSVPQSGSQRAWLGAPGCSVPSAGPSSRQGYVVGSTP